MKYKILSLYWDNIDKSIVKLQAEVFSFLNLKVEQHQVNGLMHGDWMDIEVSKCTDDEIIIFCDIDAFPINRNAFEYALAFANFGGIFGLAQVANHIDKDHIYAGPMFLAFKKSTWISCGRPTLSHSQFYDVGQNLTYSAQNHGIPIEIKYPTECLVPLWNLSDKGYFGIGTFFGNDFFHLFESRKQSHVVVFDKIVSDIINGKNLSLESYRKLLKI